MTMETNTNQKRCFFCDARRVSDCDCEASEDGEGFMFDGVCITEPQFDATSRRFVNPVKEYGEAYLDSKHARGCGLEITRVHRYGTVVRCTNVDPNGFCGRELHPGPEDVGFLGIVVGNLVEDGCDVKVNALGGTPIAYVPTNPGADCPVVCYYVQDASGRRLMLMDFEIEVVEG